MARPLDPQPETNRQLGNALEVMPNTPLWQRAPVRDEYGRLLSDFMMIVPGLNRRPKAEISDVLRRIEHVLGLYGRSVVFADLNLRLNTLWVSVRPVPGICLELPAVIHHYVAEAVLVHHPAR